MTTLTSSFLQQLLKQNPLGLEVSSNGPVKFRFASGEKSTTATINHAQIVKLVEEVASPSQIKMLPMNGQLWTDYVHNGTPLKVEVLYLAPERWQVKIDSGQGSSIEAEPTQVTATSQVTSTPQIAVTPQISATPTVQQPSANYTASSQTLDPIPQTPTPTPRTPNPTGAPRIEYYLRLMIERKASDLHMSSEAAPLARISGDIQSIDGDRVLSHSELYGILMDIIPEENREQFEKTSDADFAYAMPGLARFRANYFTDRNGIGAVFRQIPYEILTSEQLGIPKEVLNLCWLSKGLVLVTGPTGSGKSTTLATLIDYINQNRSDHIITIEDPIEFVHQNKKCLVNQREIGKHTKSFKTALKAALREDPDIVLVGEMRDLETISIAVETAETGHLVFGTLHTSTAPSTVDRIIDQFPAEQQAQIRVMLAESLKGVVSQVLCKKKEKGRAAAYEILMGNSAVSNLIREGKTNQLKSIMQTGKKEGMMTMNDSLLALVKANTVDAKEAYVKAVDKQGLKMMFQQNGIKIDLADVAE
ncbi:MAG: type IV pilus twitching motility protein PilT [Trueperaceae bacterium]